MCLISSVADPYFFMDPDPTLAKNMDPDTTKDEIMDPDPTKKRPEVAKNVQIFDIFSKTITDPYKPDIHDRSSLIGALIYHFLHGRDCWTKNSLTHRTRTTFNKMTQK